MGLKWPDRFMLLSSSIYPRHREALGTVFLALIFFHAVSGKVAVVGSKESIEFGPGRNASLAYSNGSDEFVLNRAVRAPNLDLMQQALGESRGRWLSILPDMISPLLNVSTSTTVRYVTDATNTTIGASVLVNTLSGACSHKHESHTVDLGSAEDSSRWTRIR